MISSAASLARAVARLNPKSIAVTFQDEDGRWHTAWVTPGSEIELAGAAGILYHEINWGVPSQGKVKLLPKLRSRTKLIADLRWMAARLHPPKRLRLNRRRQAKP